MRCQCDDFFTVSVGCSLQLFATKSCGKSIAQIVLRFINFLVRGLIVRPYNASYTLVRHGVWDSVSFFLKCCRRKTTRNFCGRIDEALSPEMS